MNRSHLWGAVYASIFLLALGALTPTHAASLTFTGTTTETGPGVPPLPPLEWDVTVGSEDVYGLAMTPELVTPTVETLWTIPHSHTVRTTGMDSQQMPEAGDIIYEDVSFDLSSLSGNVIQISNARFDPSGAPNLLFDATLTGVWTASHIFRFATNQPATFTTLEVVPDTSSLAVTLGLVFTDNSDPDLPVFTGELTGDITFVPIPPAAGLFGSGLLGLLGVARRKKA